MLNGFLVKPKKALYIVSGCREDFSHLSMPGVTSHGLYR